MKAAAPHLPAPPPAPPQSGLHHALSTAVQLLIIIPLALFIKSNTIELFKIPTGSMEPTLYGANDMGRGFGDHLLVLRFPYGLSGTIKVPLLNWRIQMPYRRLNFGGMHTPRVGDVVVFENPVDPAIDYIKRCCGASGDRLAVRAGHLFVNGCMITNAPATASYVRYTNVGLLSTHFAEVRRQVAKIMEYKLANILATNPAAAAAVCAMLRGPRGAPTPAQLIGTLRNNNELLVDLVAPYVRMQLTRMMERENCAAIKNAVYINGTPYRKCEANVLRGGHIADPIESELCVPDDCYFMMGDNSAHSLDSRYWGFAPLELIKGKAWVVYLPIKRMQLVR
jgi:signal peptidase I